MRFFISQKSVKEKAFQYDVKFEDLDRNVSLSENTDLNYSITGFKMSLERSLKPFVINLYLPTALLVTVSFIGFLIPAEMIPGRMALIVTTFLMLINIENTHSDDGPKAGTFMIRRKENKNNFTFLWCILGKSCNGDRNMASDLHIVCDNESLRVRRPS